MKEPRLIGAGNNNNKKDAAETIFGAELNQVWTNGRYMFSGISALGGGPDCEAMNHSDNNAKAFNECCPDEAR